MENERKMKGVIRRLQKSSEKKSKNELQNTETNFIIIIIIKRQAKVRRLQKNSKKKSKNELQNIETNEFLRLSVLNLRSSSC